MPNNPDHSALRLRLAELATLNGGSVTGAAIRALGITARQVDGLVANGVLHRTRRDHFLVGHTAPSLAGSRYSKVAQAGDGALLASIAAIDHWGFLPWDTDVTHIVVPKQRRPVEGAFVRVRPHLTKAAASECAGMPILAPEYAVFDACDHLDGSSIRRIIREGRFKKRLSIERLQQIAATSLRGVTRFRTALRLWDGGDNGHASAYELRVDRALGHDVLEGSLANPMVQVGGERLFPDRVWFDLRIAVECDGPPHDEPDQQRVDRVRRAALRVAGWDVHVVHWRDFERDPTSAVASAQYAVRRARSARTTRNSDP